MYLSVVTPDRSCRLFLSSEMVSCVACGRTRNQTSKINGIIFHHFPKNEERKKCWLKFINKTNWKPSRNSFLCSEHFTKDCFDRSSRLKVRLSVPVIEISRSKYICYLLHNIIQKIL